MKKKILVIILTILIILLEMQNVLADTSFDKLVSDGDAFLQEGIGEDSPIDNVSLKETSNFMYNTLLVIGVAVAIIWGGVLGIKFIIGGLEEKAEVKKALIIYIIGCIIIFGAFGIWRVVIRLLEPLT